MQSTYNVAVIGAGPAGLSAAVQAAEQNLSVIVLDENPQPGGQMYRALETADKHRLTILGPHYQDGRKLLDRFHQASLEYLPGSTIWNATPEGQVFYANHDGVGRFQADFLLITTGTHERPVPLPGWTLPGVMGAGAVDSLFKSSGLVPQGPVILAGTGPLLYLLACHLLECNVTIRALLDTRTRRHALQAMPFFPMMLSGLESFLEGLGLYLKIGKARIPVYRHFSELRAHGDHHLAEVSFLHNRSRHSLAADTLILHDGVIPNTQLTRLLGCEHEWQPKQRCLQSTTDRWGQSSLAKIFVAGDGKRVYGAKCAAWAGQLAALQICFQLGAFSQNTLKTLAAPIQRRLKKEQSIRPFLDRLFQPNPQFLSPPDETIICRCEDVSAGQVRQAVFEGLKDPNQLKSELRCGMGMCQGRLCGHIVPEIIAGTQESDIGPTESLHVRPPLKPIPLSRLAALQ